jgi:hypothetical protein
MNNSHLDKPFTKDADKKKLLAAVKLITQASKELLEIRPKEPLNPKNQSIEGLIGVKYFHEYQEYLEKLNNWRKAVTQKIEEITHHNSEVSRALGKQNVKEIIKSLKAQATRRKGRFYDEMAPIGLLEIFLYALLNYYLISQNVKFTKQPKKANWQNAINAVNCLIKEGENGVPLGLVGIRINMFDLSLTKLRLLERELIETANRTPKTHTDKYLTEREACRNFVHNLYCYFGGVAPPTFVKRFCKLINYESEKVERQYIKQWTSELVNKTEIDTCQISIKIR